MQLDTEKSRKVLWRLVIAFFCTALAAGLVLSALNRNSGVGGHPRANGAESVGLPTPFAEGAPSVAPVQGAGGLRAASEPPKARVLAQSFRLAHIDQLMLRLMSECTIPFQLTDGETYVRKLVASQQGEKSFEAAASQGGASEDQRLAALRRAHQKCASSFDGRELSNEEYIALRAQPQFAAYVAILKAAVAQPIDLSSTATNDSLKEIFSQPMLGAIGMFFHRNMDTSALGEHYSDEQVLLLRMFLQAQIPCRLGDDCDTGGLVTERFCWDYGMCEASVDIAVLAHLTRAGIDPGPYFRFLDQTMLSIRSQNFGRLVGARARK